MQHACSLRLPTFLVVPTLARPRYCPCCARPHHASPRDTAPSTGLSISVHPSQRPFRWQQAAFLALGLVSPRNSGDSGRWHHERRVPTDRILVAAPNGRLLARCGRGPLLPSWSGGLRAWRRQHVGPRIDSAAQPDGGEFGEGPELRRRARISLCLATSLLQPRCHLARRRAQYEPVLPQRAL
jgi:hypothetical protein